MKNTTLKSIHGLEVTNTCGVVTVKRKNRHVMNSSEKAKHKEFRNLRKNKRNLWLTA